MRRILIWLGVMVLILASCNYPYFPSNSTATVDLIGTEVSQRLTQYIPKTVTAIPNSTSTVPAPVASTTPTPTSSPASPPPTALSSITSTQPAKSTATSTGIPGDPRISLGAPTWKDNFQKASTWGLDTPYDDGHTRISITNGRIILKSYAADGWHGWRLLTNPKIQDFYLEVTIQLHACAGNDTYGIIFRSSENAKGYWFGITCDGRYSLKAGDINDSTEVIKLKLSPLIQPGANQNNRIGVMARGNKLTLYANGKQLDEIVNDAFTSSGSFGYFIAASKTASFTYESAEIAYWLQLP